MRFTRNGLAGLLAGLMTVAAAACGGGGHGRARLAPTQTPAPVPTPDTTPIEALRTPAGLILKTGPESSATRPTSGPASTPTKGPGAS
jgi:hypothetical protein